MRLEKMSRFKIVGERNELTQRKVEAQLHFQTYIQYIMSEGKKLWNLIIFFIY